MNLLDLLFWLMIALMCGIAWAIESGLSTRHRKALLASTLSTFASVLFIMFWIDDETAFKLGKKPTAIHRHGSDDEEAGHFEFEKDGKKSGGDGEAAAAADAAAKKKKEEEGPPEYSTEPFRDCRLCPDMVVVNVKPDDPGPVRRSFAIGRLEVLRQEYVTFLQSSGYTSSENCDIHSTKRGKFSWRSPGFEQDGRHPVVCVSPADADAFVSWLSTRTGFSYRLPSDDEWTYAARGGSKTSYWTGSEVTGWQANFGNSRDGTVAGGSLQINPYGLADVSGNAAEIIANCATDAGAGKHCQQRLVKGGAWNSPGEMLRVDKSQAIAETASDNTIGFRVMRDIDERDNDKILTKARKAAIAADEKAAAEIEARDKAAAEKAEQERIAAEAKAAAGQKK